MHRLRADLLLAVLLLTVVPASSGQPTTDNGQPTVSIDVVAGTDDIGDGDLATDAVIAGISGIAVDAEGNAYFCDVGHNRVRRIDAVSRMISTVAGSDRYGAVTSPGSAVGEPFASPTSLALADGYLYVVEIVGKRVRQINLKTTKVVDLGAPRGGFGQPVFVTKAASGLLVVDTLRGQVWRWNGGTDWTGVFADTGPFDDGIRAVAEDADGNLYVSSFFGRTLRRWIKSSGKVETLATKLIEGESANVPMAQRIGTTDGLILDAEGYLYFSDMEHERICRFDPQTHKVTIAHQSSMPQDHEDSWVPSSLALDPWGNVWAADVRRNRVLRFTGRKAEVMAGGGSIGDGGSGVGARLFHPGRLAVDRRGGIYVSDAMAHRVRYIDPRSGKIRTIAGIGVAGFNGDLQNGRRAMLNYPGGLVVDPAGTTLYIADYYNNRVRALDLKTNVIRTIGGDGIPGEEGRHLLNPHALALDGEGGLLVTSAVTASVRRIDLKTGRIHRIDLDPNVVPPYRTLVFYGITAGPGTFFLADGMRSSILRYAHRKMKKVETGVALNYPMDVAVAPDGALFICDTRNDRILRWQEGRGTEVVAEKLGRPRGIVLDRNGDLYVADTFNSRVLKLTMPHQLSVVRSPLSGDRPTDNRRRTTDNTRTARSSP